MTACVWLLGWGGEYSTYENDGWITINFHEINKQLSWKTVQWTSRFLFF